MKERRFTVGDLIDKEKMGPHDEHFERARAEFRASCQRSSKLVERQLQRTSLAASLKKWEAQSKALSERLKLRLTIPDNASIFGLGRSSAMEDAYCQSCGRKKNE